MDFDTGLPFDSADTPSLHAHLQQRGCVPEPAPWDLVPAEPAVPAPWDSMLSSAPEQSGFAPQPEHGFAHDFVEMGFDTGLPFGSVETLHQQARLQQSGFALDPRPAPTAFPGLTSAQETVVCSVKMQWEAHTLHVAHDTHAPCLCHKKVKKTGKRCFTLHDVDYTSKVETLLARVKAHFLDRLGRELTVVFQDDLLFRKLHDAPEAKAPKSSWVSRGKLRLQPTWTVLQWRHRRFQQLKPRFRDRKELKAKVFPKKQAVAKAKQEKGSGKFLSREARGQPPVKPRKTRAGPA